MANLARGHISRGPSDAVVARLAQQCAELGRVVAASDDTCALAWDAGDRPVVVAAAGPVETLLGASAADLIGKPAGMLFSGGDRSPRDLAHACRSGAVAEERLMLRAGQAFPAQILVRAGDEGAVALVRDLSVTQHKSD